MDLLYFVRDKLRFIERHYKTAVEPFVTIKVKIHNGEEPYNPAGPNVDPESDEPPFVEEWIEADESVNIVGCSCLCLVQSVLLEYLREYLQELNRTLPNGTGNLLSRYRSFFRDQLGIDWDRGPVPFDILEDLTLARNHIQHETKITSRYARQTSEYSRRFPKSLFGDNYEFKRIIVTEASLEAAVCAVERFCEFMDHQ
jgi:hypothetical protein